MANGAIWILGATGRTGRAVASRLVAEGLAPVLVGRDKARLEAVAEKLEGGAAIKVAAALPAIAAAISRERPAIVLNTVGPFIKTATPIIEACTDGTHYIDLSNELSSVQAVLAMHDRAAAAGSILVTGAGFGVLATESVILKLCDGRTPPTRVRCAAIADVESVSGRLGEAFAASVVEGIGMGGRRYDGGHIVRAPLMVDFERVALPTGKMVGTASAPSGELEAARRASNAPFVVSATSMVPSSPFLRAILPALLMITKIAAVRRFAIERIAAIEVKAAAVPIARVSWAYGRVEWSSEPARHGWLRTGDAMDFTAAVMARVAIRLANGDGTPGAYTPGALFGFELAAECGGELIMGVLEKEL